MASRFETLRPLLENVSVGFFNDSKNYIGKVAAPIVPVEKSSHYYPVFGAENLIIPARGGIRANSTESERVSWTYSTDQYSTQEHSFVSFIDDRDRENADSELRVYETQTRMLTERLLLVHEKAVADKLFNVTTFSGYTAALSGTDRWDHASSDPTVQVALAKASITLGGVVNPEEISLFVGYDVFAALQVNAKLLTRYQYTDPSVLTPDMIAKALGVKKLYVGNAVYNNAGTRTRLWGKFALFAYVPESPALYTPATAYTFALNGGKPKLRGYRREELKSDALEGAMDYDVKLVNAASGYLYSTVVS